MRTAAVSDKNLAQLTLQCVPFRSVYKTDRMKLAAALRFALCKASHLSFLLNACSVHVAKIIVSLAANWARRAYVADQNDFVIKEICNHY